MSEFRRDPLSGRWVIVAPERSARPTDFPVERRYGVGGFCPFCEGNEDKTPPEIFSIRKDGTAPNGPGWRVRVVPNRFPALQMEDSLARQGDGLCRRMNGLGAHEVIIESPRHVLSLCELDCAGVKEVFLTYRGRLRGLREDPRLAYGMIFKNVGAAAGATVEHSHSQLIATPVVPAMVRTELRNARKHHEAHGACLLCDILSAELAAGVRVVARGDHFVALAPFAARFPFETWVLPKAHVPHFEEHPAEALDDLAATLCGVLRRLDAALGSPAYNYLIHTSPFGRRFDAYYHWHIEIIPCVTRVAGFEWGTGVYINPVLPESAAAFLTEIRV